MGLFFYNYDIYPRNDLNVYDNVSANLKFALSTNSSTRIFFFFYLIVEKVHNQYKALLSLFIKHKTNIFCIIFKLKTFKARMIWTLIWAIMSSLLYQLSYSLLIKIINYLCGQRICTFIYRSWACYVTITSIRILIIYTTFSLLS